jgi:dienelactone hydrolase
MAGWIGPELIVLAPFHLTLDQPTLLTSSWAADSPDRLRRSVAFGLHLCSHLCEIPRSQLITPSGELETEHSVRAYPHAGHAFCAASSPFYAADAAEAAWTEAIGFLDAKAGPR